MMGQGGQGGGMMGQGGMMGRGGMMGQDMGGQDMSGCPMMGDMMGFRRGMKQGMGQGAMMHSVPMMEGRLAYIKRTLRSPTPRWRPGMPMPTRSGRGTRRWKACPPR